MLNIFAKETTAETDARKFIDPKLKTFLKNKSKKVRKVLYHIFQKGYDAGYQNGYKAGTYKSLFEIKKLEKEAYESVSHRTGLLYYGRASHRAYIWNYLTCFLLSFIGIGIILLIYLYHDIKNTVITITNDHIKIRKGILTKANRYIDLWRIQEICMQEDIFNRLSKTVDLEITYVNGHHTTLKLKGIPSEKNVHERLLDAVEVAKNKRILFLTETAFN